MNRATPQMRYFAKRLIVYERNGDTSPETEAAFPIPEKLRPHLAALMGNGGFQTLLMRAVVLATKEIPALSGVWVKADGSLEGLAELYGRLDAAEMLEARGYFWPPNCSD